MAFQPQRQYQQGNSYNTSDPQNSMVGVRRDANTSSAADGQYEALHTDVGGRLKVSSQNGPFDVVTGTITAATQTVAADVSRAGSATISVYGTYTGVNLTFEAYDGVNWVGLWAQQTDVQSVVLVSGVIASVTRAWDVSPLLGFTQIRVRATAWASGTANIRIIPAVQAPELAPYVTGAVTVSGTVTANAGTLTAGTAYSLNTAATTNAVSLKSSAGTLYEITVSNVTATGAYVKFYNKTSAPTVGTDIPILTIPVPPTSASAGLVNLSFGTVGKRFSTGIAIAVTAGAPATDTAVAVAGIQVSATYI